MSIADTYRDIGIRLRERSETQKDLRIRTRYEALARNYFLQAMKAEKNSRNEIIEPRRGKRLEVRI
jgi:ATP phosphoribosyltransferase